MKMIDNENRVIIIGAGPAGLFAAKTILERENDAKVLILEKGSSIEERQCRGQEECLGCKDCSIICGAGGAGMYSDGKLVLDLSSGGDLQTIDNMSEKDKEGLCTYIKDTLISYDGVSEYKPVPNIQEQRKIKSIVNGYGFGLKLYSVLHMGTNNLKKIITAFLHDLLKTYSERFSILYNTEILEVNEKFGRYTLVDQCNKKYSCQYVVIGVGKTGANWSKQVLKRLGCHYTSNMFYFGLRIETKAEVLNPLFEYSFDPKIFKIFSDGTKVKMHCVCRQGDIRPYRSNNNLLVGGHTYYTKENHCVHQSNKANFNILMAFNPQVFDLEELLGRFRKISSKKVLVQTLGDFKSGKVSKRNVEEKSINAMATWGNIRDIVEEYNDFPKKVIDFIEGLNSICPGISDDENLLYGPALEWTMDRVYLNDVLETEKQNIFAVGDGAGISQGIVYSAATGIIAAKEICERMKMK